MNALYSHRDFVAALPSAALIAFLAVTGVKEATKLAPKYDDPVKLEIVDITEVPPPPAPPKEKTPLPEPEPKPLPVTKPVQQEAAPQPVQAPAAPATPSQPTPPQPAPTPRAETPQPPKPNIEGEYIGRIRAYLNSIKRYPTGREASLQRPQGTTKVWFVMRRDGSVVESGIEESSNSTLLDNAARQTVNRASFPAFPEQFKPGETTHRFTVDLQFTPV